MARRPTPQWIALKARVPRGYEDYWRLIRAAAAAGAGTFTISEIAGETNAQRQSVEHYVARLRAGGFVGLAEPAKINKPNVFRLLKSPTTAPRLRADGSEITIASAQERLWRAMRSLVRFSTRELAYAATVEKHPVLVKTAQRYVNQLACAGYLEAQGASRRPALYRLKPGMNTGPKPPSILAIDAVWDRNLNEVIGEPVAVAREIGPAGVQS